jgi:hypothetical protein
VEFKESDRMRTRLLAINLRLAELDHELRRTQVRVQQLESRLEDARLARLVGEDAGDPAEIGPELERSRGSLERQQELVNSVKANQMDARKEWAVARMKERREERAAADAEPVARNVSKDRKP